jgi:integrase
MSKRSRKLFDQVRQAIRRKHYSIRTEEAYVHWIKRYMSFTTSVIPRAGVLGCSGAEVNSLLSSDPLLLHPSAPWLLYGSRLRLMECVRLWVKDLDFGQHQIIVRDGKGWITMNAG